MGHFWFNEKNVIGNPYNLPNAVKRGEVADKHRWYVVNTSGQWGVEGSWSIDIIHIHLLQAWEGGAVGGFLTNICMYIHRRQISGDGDRGRNCCGVNMLQIINSDPCQHRICGRHRYGRDGGTPLKERQRASGEVACTPTMDIIWRKRHEQMEGGATAWMVGRRSKQMESMIWYDRDGQRPGCRRTPW